MRGLFGRRGRRARRGGKPLLAVDVDGVVSLFGFDEGGAPEGAVFEVVGGTLHCIATASGERLRRLGEHFDLVWASGWEGRATRLAAILGLPEIPYLEFGGEAEFGSADWKLGPLGDYAAGRPLAWIDDSLDDECYEWARRRPEPTLLVPAEPDAGLTEVHVEALVGWARSLRAEREGEVR